MTKKLFGLILLVGFLASCKSGKLSKKGTDLGEISEATELFTEIKSPEYSQIKFKSDADLSSSFLSQKFPINIQLEKGKIIWASVSMGLELGRAKITPDSIQVMDRFGRRAYVGTWADVSNLAGIDLGFDILQSLLIGDLIFRIEPGDDFSMEKGHGKLLQSRGKYNFETKIDPQVARPFEILGTDDLEQDKINLFYKSFVTISERLLPTVVSLSAKSGSEIRLEIKHSKVEFFDKGELNFSFTIPATYKRINLSDL